MADTEIGKAYVQIVPTATGIKDKLKKELDGPSEESGKEAGFKIGNAIKTAIAAVGIGKVIKDSVAEGAKLEQSFGGLDTIYGAASDAAKKYAAEAAAAGISANDYAEQAVSFGAALKQAFGGDTTKAAEAANTAILDMTDNAAKMGTSIESIQNAYQGFAKGNYTMLDNLKLGYGGTKTEMERLLADAQKISGVEYNIDNLGDVYDAIHVIQGDLGLTGVAAEEASTTFSGSLDAMKAAAQNVLGNLALGENIWPSLKVLGETVQSFLVGNAIPMVTNIIKMVPGVISAVLTSDMIPSLLSAGAEMLTSIVRGFSETIPVLLEDIANMIPVVVTTLVDGLPALIDGAVSLFTGIIEAIPYIVPNLIAAMPQIIVSIVGALIQSIPTILNGATDMLTGIVDAIPVILPQILAAMPQIITGVIKTLIQAAPQILKAAGTMLGGIVTAIPKILSSALSAISNVGRMLVQGLWNGISNVKEWVLDKIRGFGSSILSGIKGIFGIHSPSKEMEWMGEMLDRGLAKGITGGIGDVEDAMDVLGNRTMWSFDPTISAAGGSAGAITNMGGVSINVYGAPGQDVEKLAEIVMNEIQNAVDRGGVALA